MGGPTGTQKPSATTKDVLIDFLAGGTGRPLFTRSTLLELIDFSLSFSRTYPSVSRL